jgi:hypothetical protein
MQKLYIEMSEGSMVQGKNNYSVNTKQNLYLLAYLCYNFLKLNIDSCWYTFVDIHLHIIHVYIWPRIQGSHIMRFVSLNLNVHVIPVAFV